MPLYCDVFNMNDTAGFTCSEVTGCHYTESSSFTFSNNVSGRVRTCSVYLWQFNESQSPQEGNRPKAIFRKVVRLNALPTKDNVEYSLFLMN